MVVYPCLSDGIHTDFRVVLAMPLRFRVVLAAAQLEDLHFHAAPVTEHRGRDLRPGHEGVTELHGVSIRDHEHLVEDDLSANVCRYLFYFDFLAGGNAILLAAGFYDRVHCGLLDLAKRTVHSIPRRAASGELAIIREIPRKVKDLTGTVPAAPVASRRPPPHPG